MPLIHQAPATDPVASFAHTFQGTVRTISAADQAANLTLVKKFLAHGRLPTIGKLSDLSRGPVVRRLLATGSVLDEIREALGIAVPLLAPIVASARRESKPREIERQLRETAEKLREVVRGDRRGTLRRQLDPYVRRPEPGGYTRTWLFYEEGLIEILLLCWEPGARAPIHDHAGSSGADCVVEGMMVEESFERLGGGDPVWRAHRLYNPGDVIAFSGHMLHATSNPPQFDQTLLTVHAYTPPIDMERVQLFGV